MSQYKKYSDLAETKTDNADDIIIDIKSSEQKLKLITGEGFNGHKKVAIVDVYADWCMPCKSIAPRFASLAKEYSKYGFIFAKENSDSKISTEVRGVPTFQYFYDGKLVGSTVGADMADVKLNLDKLKSTMESNI